MSIVKKLTREWKRKLKDRSYTHGGIVGMPEGYYIPPPIKHTKKKKRKRYKGIKKANGICDRFKQNFKNKTNGEKLSELNKLANHKRKNKIPYKVRRERKHWVNSKCWVCNYNKATCQHHIIPIINGGFDNKNNRIPICDECHNKIHPWLEANEGILKMDEAFRQTLM